MTAFERGSRLTASVSPARREGSVEPGSELIRAKDPFTLVIFGASGDLAKRKLIPALYYLKESGYLADRYAVLGFSRTPMSDEAYRDVIILTHPDHSRTLELGKVAPAAGEPA